MMKTVVVLLGLLAVASAGGEFSWECLIACFRTFSISILSASHRRRCRSGWRHQSLSDARPVCIRAGGAGGRTRDHTGANVQYKLQPDLGVAAATPRHPRHVSTTFALRRVWFGNFGYCMSLGECPSTDSASIFACPHPHSPPTFICRLLLQQPLRPVW